MPAEDLSGIACLPYGPDGARECLVVNDENKGAQHARLVGEVLSSGTPVPLLGDELPKDARGIPPTLACPGGSDDFADLDGEGVAVAPGGTPESGTFYVVGSHGCSRAKAKGRLSSFLLARVPFIGGHPGRPELTWRLSAVLQVNPELAPFFTQPLNEDHQGLNVEGIAAVGGDLLFGLRAPSQGGRAFLIRVPVSTLFAPDQPGNLIAETIPLELAEGVGIRDLTALPDGRLLVLAGPAQEQATPYTIWLAELNRASASKPSASLRRLAALRDIEVGQDRAKAEAILFLGEEGGKLRVLLLFDGLANGGPRTYLLPR
ncbi:DUF3616 domain-containing protein [Belnapia sp. T6]|uniref:DUF3616 domain-containing protein n=1 Tax=Belnapia mucosa TaxID=2804532 RepID=A0ABS1VAI4_9PROT|nr:DUF3616 domain-containing protein [Belnapia mucosa]MBL6458696.1 DUF3616 domain-containing protein [Belnapia mucosa]